MDFFYYAPCSCVDLQNCIPLGSAERPIFLSTVGFPETLGPATFPYDLSVHTYLVHFYISAYCLDIMFISHNYLNTDSPVVSPRMLTDNNPFGVRVIETDAPCRFKRRAKQSKQVQEESRNVPCYCTVRSGAFVHAGKKGK